MYKSTQKTRQRSYSETNKIARNHGNYYNLVLMIIGVFLIVSLAGNLVRIKKSREKVDDMKQRVVKLEEEKQKLTIRKQAIESDTFIEKQIRDNLGLAKEGEMIVVLPSDDVLRSLAPVQEIEVEIEIIPNWKKWRDLFL